MGRKQEKELAVCEKGDGSVSEHPWIKEEESGLLQHLRQVVD